MENKPITQLESKFLADHLNRKYNIRVSNSLFFHRMSIAKAMKWVKDNWNEQVSEGEISRAMRRDTEKQTA